MSGVDVTLFTLRGTIIPFVRSVGFPPRVQDNITPLPYMVNTTGNLTACAQGEVALHPVSRVAIGCSKCGLAQGNEQTIGSFRAPT